MPRCPENRFPYGLHRVLLLKHQHRTGEANVAVSLANFGMDVQYCTVLPNNVIGDECIKELRQFGVDVSKVKRGEGRMGIYFLESGANQLPRDVSKRQEDRLPLRHIPVLVLPCRFLLLSLADFQTISDMT